jgi:hypothetical protein
MTLTLLLFIKKCIQMRRSSVVACYMQRNTDSPDRAADLAIDHSERVFLQPERITQAVQQIHGKGLRTCRFT